MAIDYEMRISQFVRLRDAKKTIQDKHKLELAPINDTLEKLEALFMRELALSNQDSAKTHAGTVYKTTKKTASLEDGEEFMRFVIGGEHWELLDRKANVTAVEEFLKENKALPPGVKYTEVEEVGVRRASK